MTDTAHLGHIGRYELLARLGAGGMGEVFLARIQGTAGFEKQVVIKRMLPHLAGNETFVNRFLDEGRLVVQLRHANIAQVLDMGSDGGVIFLAMEHVDGRDLRELMRLQRGRDEPVAPEVAVGLLVRVLEALDYAHRCKDASGAPLDIIHRDVSPSNVMVSRGGEVKLVDFGIARAADRLGTSVSGAVQGKYGYMSPQQAAGGELDARSDQWSVGVMAWELLVGSRPFDGATDLETLDRIRQHEPGSLGDALPGLPEEVVVAVDRMLRKAPSERFADAGEAARALQAYLFRAEALVGARELAAWCTACLETLPPDKRAQPGATLSLDDALLLNLGGGQGSQPGAPGTVSVADAAPSQGMAGIIPTPTRPPITSPDRPVSVTDISAPQTRGRWLGVLVVLNLALLAAVALLVLEVTGEPEVVATAPTVTKPAPAPAATKSPAPAATPAPTPVVVPRKVRPESPPPAPVKAIEAATSVRLVVETTPPRATVRVKGHGSGTAPHTVEAPTGSKVTVRVSASGHQSRQVPVVMEADRTLKVTLSPTQTGTLSFRYFPASATVTVGGKTVSTSASNRVQVSLPVGKHRVVLSHGDRRRVEGFEIRADQTTNLATLTLED